MSLFITIRESVIIFYEYLIFFLTNYFELVFVILGKTIIYKIACNLQRDNI